MSNEQTEYDEVMSEMLNKQHDLTREALDAIAQRNAEFYKVMDEILAREQKFTPEVLDGLISKFPQFESELTAFAMQEAVVESTMHESSNEQNELTQAEQIDIREMAETLRELFPDKELRSKTWKKIFAEAVEVAKAAVESAMTLDDVIDEILTTGETLTGAKLNFWISRYPQFAQGLTDFAVFEAVSDVLSESETMTADEQNARLERSRRIASDVVKSKQNQTGKFTENETFAVTSDEIRLTRERAADLSEYIFTRGFGIISSDASDDLPKQAFLILVTALAYERDSTTRENILFDVIHRIFSYTFEADVAQTKFIENGFADYKSGKWDTENDERKTT